MAKNTKITFPSEEDLLLFVVSGKQDFSNKSEYISVEKGDIISLFVKGKKKPYMRVLIDKKRQYMHSFRLYAREIEEETIEDDKKNEELI